MQAGEKIILTGGKIILAGGEIILTVGEIILAGQVGKLFWQGRWENYFGRWKIRLAGGKIILPGLVTTRQSHPIRARKFLNNGM